MDLKIVSQEKNPFLQRQEIRFETDAEKTPSRKDVRAKLAALTNSKEDQILVKEIKNRFGSKHFSGHAFVYSGKDQVRKMHKFFALKRDKHVSEEEIKKFDEKRIAKKAKTEKKSK